MLAQRRRRCPALHQHWANVSCYLFLSGVRMESVTRKQLMQQSENTVQSPNAVLKSGQRERLWVNIETALGECHVFAQSIQQTQ